MINLTIMRLNYCHVFAASKPISSSSHGDRQGYSGENTEFLCPRRFCHSRHGSRHWDPSHIGEAIIEHDNCTHWCVIWSNPTQHQWAKGDIRFQTEGWTMLADQKFQPEGIRERAREPHPSLPSSNLWRIFELERRLRCITNGTRSGISNVRIFWNLGRKRSK